MALVEVLIKVRDVVDTPGPGQKANGDVIFVKPLGETASFATVMGFWDKPNVANKWFTDYPLLSAKPGVLAASQLPRAERVQWLNDNIPSDGGMSTNWGQKDLKTHACVIVENWPTALDNGEPLPPSVSFPYVYEAGGHIWETTVNVGYEGKLPQALVDAMLDDTVWLEPLWENEAAGKGIDYLDQAVTEVHADLGPIPE
jgi:hypothetical protein